MKDLVKELELKGVNVIKVEKNSIVVSKKDLIEATKVRNEIVPETDKFGFHLIDVKCRV